MFEVLSCTQGSRCACAIMGPLGLLLYPHGSRCAFVMPARLGGVLFFCRIDAPHDSQATQVLLP